MIANMPYPGPVVSVDWLYSHLSHPQVAIADCRFALADPDLGQRQYEAGHLPGAYYFDLNQDLSSPVQEHGGRHPLPDPNRLANRLAAAGIQSGNGQEATLVVVYDDSRLAFAARFWWLLRYLGHDQVVVLDGGMAAWQQAGYPVVSDRPAPKAGHFVPQLRSDWVVDRDGVKARQSRPGTVLVDSREEERYRGEREPIDPVAGHIPEAVNYPWQRVTDATGHVQPCAEQRRHWSDLGQADEIVVYCGSGVTACVNLLSLELAGISTGRLYAGSWSDWCSYL